MPILHWKVKNQKSKEKVKEDNKKSLSIISENCHGYVKKAYNLSIIAKQ